MTTTEERLRQLEQADFDTFGEQNTSAGQWPLATPEEVAAIAERVLEAPWEDPARYPECIVIALDALGAIAILDIPVAYDATQALRKILRRTEFGGPLDHDIREGIT